MSGSMEKPSKTNCDAPGPSESRMCDGYPWMAKVGMVAAAGGGGRTAASLGSVRV